MVTEVFFGDILRFVYNFQTWWTWRLQNWLQNGLGPLHTSKLRLANDCVTCFFRALWKKRFYLISIKVWHAHSSLAAGKVASAS